MTANIKAGVETITPQQAEQALGHMVTQRRVRHALVARIARDMKAGKWTLNGEAVIFDEAGRLLDGQHRMAALVQYGQPLPMLVVRGVASAAMPTIDTGAVRNMIDVLRLEGRSNAALATLAAAARNRWMYDNAGKDWGEGAQLRNPVSNHELLAVINGTPLLGRLAEVAQRNNFIRRFAYPGVVTFVWERISALQGGEWGDEYVRLLSSGDGLKAGDPIFALRRWMTERDLKSGAVSQVRMAAMQIKTFNFWMADEKREVLSWRAGEDFPLMLGDARIDTTYRRGGSAGAAARKVAQRKQAASKARK